MMIIDRYSLDPLFDPKSIAIIGASNEIGKFGGRPLYHMLKGGFEGALYPIHNSETEIQGLKAYSDIASIGQPVDLAVLAIPAAAVAGRLRECADAGVRAAVIFSSGFAEAGADGERMQAEIAEIGRATGIRIVGPNCAGLMSVKSRALPSFIGFVEEGWPRPGGIAFTCQSGAVGAHLVVLARESGLGVRAWVATGNECDVCVADSIAYFAEDPDTKVIAAYLEGTHDADKLIAALRLARRNRKPVIVIKAGSSEIGALAAASHTAALAGSDKVFDAVLRDNGAIRVHSMEEMIDIAGSISIAPLPAGKRLAIFTLSGGVGILSADGADRVGLDVAEMPLAAQVRITEIMPFATGRNPVDTSAQIVRDLAKLKASLEVIFEEADYDSVLIFVSYVVDQEPIATLLIETIRELRARHPDKLVALSAIMRAERREALEAAGCLVFEDPNRAIAVIGAMTKMRSGFAGAALSAIGTGSKTVAAFAKPLAEGAALALLGAAGVPVTPASLATSGEEAAAAARTAGFPVAMKIASADILHKSDIGGVRLNIASEGEATTAWSDLCDAARCHMPGAAIEGVTVQPMASEGVDMILGVNRDPVFGPVVLVGVGGIFVELLGDTVLRQAPFGIEEARALIDRLKARAILDGARGQPPADIDALAVALSALSVFAADNAEIIESIDINPFRVFPAGQGGMALDAVVVPVTERPS